MSTMSILICVAAVWFSQRLLSIWQSMRFRNQLLELRTEGQVSVGMSKAFGRRVYVGLAFDDQDVATAALVIRGVTVFARGQAIPEVVGSRVADLAAGRTPPGLPPLVATACTQAGEFMAARLARSATAPALDAPTLDAPALDVPALDARALDAPA